MRAALVLEPRELERRLEREVDVVAQEEVARLRLGLEASRSGSRRPRAASSSSPVVRRGRRRSSFDEHLYQAGGRLCALERLEVRVGRARSRSRAGRRRSARGGSSRPARSTSRPASTPGNGERLVERADRLHDLPVGSGPGAAVRKRIANGCWKRGSDELVGHRLAERLPQRDLDEVDADAVARRPRPSGRRGCAPRSRSTRTSFSSGETSSCGYAIPLRSPSAFDGGERDALHLGERVAEERRRVRRATSATPKPTPGGRSRSEAVIEARSSVARDDELFTSRPSW